MTKSELKTGMIVTLANGTEHYVFKNLMYGNSVEDVLVEVNGKNSWHRLLNFNENLYHKECKDYHIVKVEVIGHPYTMVRPDYTFYEGRVLWSRKKQYTYAQLREILGEEFEVIG